MEGVDGFIFLCYSRLNRGEESMLKFLRFGKETKRGAIRAYWENTITKKPDSNFVVRRKYGNTPKYFAERQGFVPQEILDQLNETSSKIISQGAIANEQRQKSIGAC